MSDTPRAPSGRDGGAGWAGGALLAGVVILFGPWAVIILAVAAFDMDYVIGTARALQQLLVGAAGAVVIIGAGLGLVGLAAAAMGVRYLFHRSAGDVVRDEVRYRGETALEAARQSQYPGLTSYTYSPRCEYEVAAVPPPPALAAPEIPAPALPPPPPGQLLQELRRRGRIGGDATQLTLGLVDDTPVAIGVGRDPMVAVGGAPRKGKSTAVVFWIAQAAMQGWAVYVCDPHGNDPQSVLGRLAPIASLLARAAVEPDEIAEAVATFDALGAARLRAGSDADPTPALLVIDELPALAMGGYLPPATMQTLIRIGSQYPKKNLLMVGIGYDWSAALFGSSPYATPLRHLARVRVVVNADAASAKHLVGDNLAKQAPDLRPGQALYTAFGSYGVISVPQVRLEDLVAVASSCPPPPAAPPIVLAAPALAAVAGVTLEPAELPLDERIVAYLDRAAGPQGSTVISAALSADNDQVCARLVELVEAGRVARSGQRRAYAYTTLPRPPRRG